MREGGEFMLHKRVAFLGLLLTVGLIVALVVALGGCTSANETSTTTQQSTTTAPGDTGTTVAPGATGTTGTTTASGETTSTPGTGESVAQVSDNFKICTQCHSNFNAFLAGSKVLTKNFSHAIHLNKGYKCEDCHVVPTHQPDKVVPPPMLNCFKCHSQEAGAKAPGACGVCHPANFSLVPANHKQGPWLPVPVTNPTKTVAANHGAEAQKNRDYCNMCHAAKFCNDCHKTPMPHATDWQQVHPQTVKSSGSGVCNQCHPAQYLCNSCHHTGFKPGSPWKQQHPPIVKANGADGCFKCHNPLTCAHCHVTGQFSEVAPSG